MKKKLGLVLSGGGARGAYQAGFLNRLALILEEDLEISQNPFSHIAGSSVGALNGSYLASQMNGEMSFLHQTENLCDLWRGLKSEKVYKTRSLELIQNGVGWLTQLGSMGHIKKEHTLSMLNASPLRDLLQEVLDFKAIKENIDSGRLDSFTVAAFDYSDRVSTHFFQSNQIKKGWTQVGQRGINSYLNWKHILASASIPMLFDTVYVHGRPFGDGNLGDLNPFGPIQKLGATDLFVIGIRNSRHYQMDRSNKFQAPSIAGLLTTQFDMLFNAPFEYQVEQLRRNMKNVAFFNPSGNIDELAGQNLDLLPSTVKLFMKCLGEFDDIRELSGYIMFESLYLRKLIEMGQNDANKARSIISNFFESKTKKNDEAA
jgi:NTE family protein